jgi:hypothetical protein
MTTKKNNDFVSQYEQEQRQRREAKNERIRVENKQRRLKLTFQWIAFLVVVGGPIAIMTHYDNIRGEENRIQVAAKWSKWVEYRNKNCKETEKIIGMPMNQGKMHYIDNATVYECKNGMKYTIAASRDNGQGGVSDIPSVD